LERATTLQRARQRVRVLTLFAACTAAFWSIIMANSKFLGLCIAAAFAALPVGAQATPLKVVNVAAPDVNCVFDSVCKLFVTDSVGDITVPNMMGKAILQSRTFSGASGAPGEGLVGYEYRVDLTQASATGRTASCVTEFTLDFGPLVQLQYNKVGPNDDVYVVTKGGLGSIGLGSANATDNKITFAFAQPVCPAYEGNKGQTSYFFGLAAKGLPAPMNASLTVSGLDPVDVKARTPMH
jgi:hypothetical protein